MPGHALGRDQPFRDELAALRTAEAAIEPGHPHDDGDEGAGEAEEDPHPDAGRLPEQGEVVTPDVPQSLPAEGQPANRLGLARGWSTPATRSWPG